MLRFSRLPALLLAFALSWMALPPANAAQTQMVSVAVKTLNMRTGPGQRYETHWTVTRGYPFRVIGKKGDWLRVSDFEGDKAWVFRPMTNKTPHHVVKAQSANLRRAPGARSPVVKKAGYGDVLRTIERRGNWLKVQHEGGATGWVQRSFVWGW
ncbi:SH3 domain-containing protein [Variovorax sp. NFACC27]|uniref:Peptide-binding protein n=1 Tax=Variovorax gossypii TaxID=1679495 RepID=A0A3S0J5Q9_9BURK|nr:SH3 domain-containing protein [Variovorax gossypii]SEF28816.1 SH3-like domain-containing protein [Variovorax sp. NFACC28]SEG79731.1 SH3-like domain-containing protein [Variovorax sp. NFACC29]SFC91908.1 SH3-like domain-containing protein [Variovorax sp. NFACC26]SFG06110.1 SH3-like domain-containing protein [Variovorax sp. NFACC27]RTQ31889.1 peptide-binding protein [Variovorax gossypii]